MAGSRALNTQDHEETKDKILTAAAGVFGEAGYHNATMTKIAQRAGVAKGTLYWYFSSKEELFLGIIGTGLSRLYSHLKIVLTNSKLGPERKLLRFIEEYLKFFDEQRHLSKIVSTGVQGLSREFHQTMLSWHQKFLQLNSELIASGIEAGLFRKELEPQQIALMFSGLLSAIGNRHLFEGQDFNEELEAEFITDFMLHGISK